MPAIATIAVLAIVALIVVFGRMTADPAPTAQNVPDYSKLTPQEVTKAYAQSKAAEAEALKGKR